MFWDYEFPAVQILCMYPLELIWYGFIIGKTCENSRGYIILYPLKITSLFNAQSIKENLCAIFEYLKNTMSK